MEFNQACHNPNDTLFETIKNKYEKANYECPNLVFWNVNARNTQSPIKHDERGTCLVSGCSPSILKTLLVGGTLTADQVMLDTLNVKRYDSVTV